MSDFTKMPPVGQGGGPLGGGPGDGPLSGGPLGGGPLDGRPWYGVPLGGGPHGGDPHGGGPLGGGPLGGGGPHSGGPYGGGPWGGGPHGGGPWGGGPHGGGPWGGGPHGGGPLGGGPHGGDPHGGGPHGGGPYGGGPWGGGPLGGGPWGGGPHGGGPLGGGPWSGGPLGGGPLGVGPPSVVPLGGGHRGSGPLGSGPWDGPPPPKRTRMTASEFQNEPSSLLVEMKMTFENALMSNQPQPSTSTLLSSVLNSVHKNDDIKDALSSPLLSSIFVDSPKPRPFTARPPPRLPTTSLRDEDTTSYPPNTGSEAESDDDDELVSTLIPRVLKSTFETPKDADYDAGDSDAAYAGDSDAAFADDSATLNDFKWKAFPNRPISHKLRRETFSESNLGPTSTSVDPYAIFIDIWDVEFMRHIAFETNRYAAQLFQKIHKLSPKYALQWHDTTVDELYVYFGLTIAMGLQVKSIVEEYWTSNCDALSSSAFSAHMDINRFCLLNRYLHFSNNEDMCALGLVGSQAKLFKIQPLVSHLNKKFQNLYNLNQDISLDGSLLQWSGSSELIPKKPATIAIKSYEICESQTGYLWRFEIHIHNESPSQQTLSTIVLNLIRGLERKGHTLWMDSYYSSPYLARSVKALGFDCAGTLRTNRKFVPPVLHSLTKENMSPGQISGLTSGDVDVMVWRDQNRVALISTYHANAVEQVRGSTKPTLILDYNTMMGGLDEKDQMLAKYPIELKRRVWYKKLFRRLLNISVFNSFIIHGHYCPSPATQLLKCSHRDFRMNLVTSLLAMHSFVPLRDLTIQQRCNDMHQVVENPVHSHQRVLRKCTVCKQLVSSFCAGCKEFVCVYPCFLSIHS